MSKAHKVIPGDTLRALAVRYLGASSQWTSIAASNPQLANRKKAYDGSPLIFPGDTLIIPAAETEKPVSANTPKPVVLSQDADQDVAIILDGKKFTGFTGYEINLAYDSFDTFSFTAPYDRDNAELRDAILPFAFKTCEVLYQEQLLFRGMLLTPDPELIAASSTITLQGYPLCGVLNDCMVPPAQYPLQCMGINMKGIADAACKPYHIPVIFEGDIGADFTEVSIEPTDKILDFLIKLAKQRDLLCTNTARGELLFFHAKTEKAFVSFVEGEPPLVSVKPKFAAQQFYSHITGYNKTDAEYPTVSYTFENKYLITKGILRHHAITIDDAETASDVQRAVTSYAGRMFADCVSFEVTCEHHVNEHNEVFTKGMTVCVYAPGAMIGKDTTFIARNIQLKRDVTGKTATLTLVLPGSYTGTLPEALPWEY